MSRLEKSISSLIDHASYERRKENFQDISGSTRFYREPATRVRKSQHETRRGVMARVGWTRANQHDKPKNPDYEQKSSKLRWTIRNSAERSVTLTIRRRFWEATWPATNAACIQRSEFSETTDWQRYGLLNEAKFWQCGQGYCKSTAVTPKSERYGRSVLKDS